MKAQPLCAVYIKHNRTNACQTQDSSRDGWHYTLLTFVRVPLDSFIIKMLIVPVTKLKPRLNHPHRQQVLKGFLHTQCVELLTNMEFTQIDLINNTWLLYEPFPQHYSCVICS